MREKICPIDTNVHFFFFFAKLSVSFVHGIVLVVVVFILCFFFVYFFSVSKKTDSNKIYLFSSPMFLICTLHYIFVCSRCSFSYVYSLSAIYLLMCTYISVDRYIYTCSLRLFIIIFIFFLLLLNLP